MRGADTQYVRARPLPVVLVVAVVASIALAGAAWAFGPSDGAGGAVPASNGRGATLAAGTRTPAPPGAASTAADALTAPAPDPTPAPLVASSAPPLPVPLPVPTDPYAAVPVDAIGQIEIPAIGVSETLYEGVWLTVIDVGPGHWPGTAMPGQWGNVVVGAHRTVETHPFADIDQLVTGDLIVFHTANGTFRYRVDGSFVVDEFSLWIIDQQPRNMVTLFACHPKGSSTHRYVVTGTLVES